MLNFFLATNSALAPPVIPKEDWEDHIKNFYVDTCSSAVTPDILRLTHDFFGPDHVCFGTDAPVDYLVGNTFVPMCLASIQGMHLNEPAQRKIYAENILSIIPQG
jgi:predicted TIM-barrel fold metal-dependent hydrolase